MVAATVISVSSGATKPSLPSMGWLAFGQLASTAGSGSTVPEGYAVLVVVPAADGLREAAAHAALVSERDMFLTTGAGIRCLPAATAVLIKQRSRFGNPFVTLQEMP
jgi:hypothetical protein